MATLKKIIRNIGESCPENKVMTVGKIVDSVDEGLFGIMLLIPSLIVVLPITFIPGISQICAAVVFLAAIHIFLGRQKLWLPVRVRNIRVCSRHIMPALCKMHHYAQKIDKLTKPRFSFFMNGIAQKIFAVTGIILAMTVIFFGFIPFISSACMGPVFFFALGICTGDGLLAGIGWAALGIPLAGTMFLI